MEKASISEVKNRLSAFLRKVRDGETILILDRNRAVARLERVDPHEAPDEALARLEQAGTIRRSRAPIPMELLRAAAPKSGRSVLEALIEERRAERVDSGGFLPLSRAASRTLRLLE